MVEYLDVYDENKNKLNKICRRDFDKLDEGEYFLIVQGIIINQQNQILVSQRAPSKRYHPLKWECNGGAVTKGEDSITAILRELKEEIGLNLEKEDAKLFKTTKNLKHQYIKDVWLFKKNIELKDVHFNDGEVVNSKFVSYEEFKKMDENGELMPVEMLSEKDYFKAIEM